MSLSQCCLDNKTNLLSFLFRCACTPSNTTSRARRTHLRTRVFQSYSISRALGQFITFYKLIESRKAVVYTGKREFRGVKQSQ